MHFGQDPFNRGRPPPTEHLCERNWVDLSITWPQIFVSIEERSPCAFVDILVIDEEGDTLSHLTLHFRQAHETCNT